MTTICRSVLGHAPPDQEQMWVTFIHPVDEYFQTFTASINLHVNSEAADRAYPAEDADSQKAMGNAEYRV